MEEFDALYRQIVETNKDGIWLFDHEGRTLYANSCIGELLGRTAEEMADLCVSDTLDDSGKEHFAAHLLELRAGHLNRSDVESKYFRPDGSALWFSVSESLILNPDGTVLGFCHRLSDYTERRELREELSSSRRLLTEAQTIAQIGGWEWDLRSDVVSWSEEMLSLLHLEPSQLGDNAEDFIALILPTDQPVVREAIRKALEEDGEFGYDARVKVGDHETFAWFRARGVVTYDKFGLPLRLGGTVQDITLAKETELQALDSASVNLLMQAIATAANEAETLSQVLAVALELLLAHEDWSRAVALEPVADTDTFVPIEVAKAGAEATPVRIEATDFEIEIARRAMAARTSVFEEELDPQAPRIAFPVVVADEVAAVIVITASTPLDRRQTMQSLVDQVGGQLERVVERARAAEELGAARDAAMEASRLKSEFLATMSHEIRTPMNGVIGLNDLLLRTELDTHQRRLAEGVRGAGRGLLAIISDILDFSKIEAGKLQLESVEFEVRPVFDQVAAMLAESARGKGLELVVGVASGVPERLVGDPTRLSQIMSNLISNAVKFTETGEVVVRCYLDSDDRGQVRLRVEVSDTGIGVEKATQDRLFEPFRQADASTTRNYGGTGLGLAISAQLVAALGGEIGVESKLGEGSTFWFTARYDTSPHDMTTKRPNDLEQVIIGRRALVVDDNESNRLVVRELLSEWGLVVEEAAAADDALKVARDAARSGAPFDVVLLDLCMPRCDGLELAAMLRSAPDVPPTRLILLSSVDQLEPTVLEEAGILVSLTKPLSSNALFEGLMEVFRRDTSGSSLPDVKQANAESRGKHVLVVEDNEVNQLVARGVLAALGYSTEVAFDGQMAVELFEPGKFDVVLMDVQMPRMDGYTATRSIRGREGSGPRVPILAMTAAAVEGERDRCLAAGMDEFLTKPLESTALEAALRHWTGADGRPKLESRGRRPEAVPVVTPDLDPQRIDMLLEMGQGADALVEKVIANFVTRAPEAVQEIRTALTQQDVTSLRATAHRLKGSALNVGAARVAEVAAQIELLAESGKCDGVDYLMVELETVMQRAVAALQRRSAHRSSSR